MSGDCRRVRDRLTEFLDGECDRREASFLDEHLRTCPSCRAELDLAAAIRTEISETSGFSEIGDRRRILASAAPLLRPRRPRLRADRALRALAAAALVLFAIWLTLDGALGPAGREGPSKVLTYRELRRGEDAPPFPLAAYHMERPF